MIPNSLPANPLLLQPARLLPTRVGVIGAGTIGPDIAYYLLSALPGLRLVLVDIDAKALERARARLQGYSDKAVTRGRMTRAEAGVLDAALVTTLDYGDLAGCDWVIEAATEDLAIKHRIFAQIEAVVGTQAVITSNTSSLPAARLFPALRHPGRATVTHFFAPAWRNPVVEVITWARVDADVVQWLRHLFAITGKVPLVTRDAVCFMLDRVFDNWCNEAAHLLEHATAAQIDGVALEFVHAGPFFVLNLANGNPIIIETNTLQADEEGEHYRPAPILASVDRWRTSAAGKPAPAVGDESRARIRDRLFGILCSQAVDVLDRDIGLPEDLDLGCRLAFGLRQGVLESMERAGEAEVDRVLARLAGERPGMPGRRRALADYTRRHRHLLVDDVDGVKVLTLRRPEAMNALHDDMTDEILGLLQQYRDDMAVRGVVITGYGNRAFCAGADIGRFPSLLGNAAAAAEYARACSRLLVALDDYPKPVVAALNGVALGGGLELAIRCHDIVAIEGAALQFPEVTLGIVPGIGGMVVPYRRWPAAAELFDRMLRTGARIDAATAAASGVLATVATQAELLPAALARVRERAAASRPSLDGARPARALGDAPLATPEGLHLSAAVRAILDAAIREAAAAPDLAAALEIGYRAFGATACTGAAREGILSFGERRKPDFNATG